MRVRQPSLTRVLIRASPIAFLTGLGYDAVRFSSSGIDTALIRGLETGVEGAALMIGPAVVADAAQRLSIRRVGTPHDRLARATFSILSHGAYIGAVGNGVRQFFDSKPDLSVYPERLLVGGAVGMGVASLPLLHNIAVRHGVYRGLWNGYRAINRGIYNMFENPITAKGYPMAGAAAGIISVAGAHIGTAFTLYGLGKLIL